MKELLDISLLPFNAVWSVILFGLVLYWLFVMLGAVDVDAFDVDVDFDVDADLDVDIDADVDVDTDVDGSTASDSAAPQPGLGVIILRFLNLDQLPLMLVLSIFILAAWVVSVIGNHYIGNNASSFALMWLPVVIIGGVIVTKFVTEPLKAIVKPFKSKYAESINFVGKVCEIKLTTNKLEQGQAEVIIEDDPILVNVKCNSNHILKLGDKAVIVDENKEENYYLVEPFNS